MPADAIDPLINQPRECDREEFARLFSRHARRIYGFILTLVFSHQDAEEVFQNTSVVLWDKFAEFQAGTNFFAWASKVAYYEVLNLMKSQRRSHTFSHEALESLATEAVALSDESSRAPKQIATMQSRSVYSVYRALSRIHMLLLNCVQRNLAREELL
jgi:DNA-directed RNA polymerase specialized sigma24 family protein